MTWSRSRQDLSCKTRNALAVFGLSAFFLGLIVVAPLPAQGETELPEVDEERSSESGSKQEEAPEFGGPDQVDNQLKSDAEAGEPVFQGYWDSKGELAEEHGFSFGLDYSAVYFAADDGPAEDDAAGGMVRFFGSWDLVGRESGNTGALVWKVEHRHGYTDIPPGDFGFNLGYVGLIEPPFSDQKLRLTNFYWRQRLNKGRFALLGGWVDPTDYMDVYALASPWTGFTNFVFSTGSATIAVPNEGLGLAAGGMITDKLFLIGGMADTNSDPTDPGDGFDTFFSTNEYFKHIEIGWTPSQGQIYLDNVHLTLWHADEREGAMTPSGWGANFSISRYLKGKWLPFVRIGYADDGGSLLEASVSTGFGYQRVPGKNLLGVGLNWGRPNESTFSPGPDDQWTAEIFYRWQATRAFAITPDLQYLDSPALNPEQSSIWIWGLRARMAL
jgi:porin